MTRRPVAGKLLAMPSPQTRPLAATPRPAGVASAVVAAVVALAVYAVLHWTGTGMISDNWAYWQGAISLSTGNGYTYFAGPRIEAWPPLFPLYLALWVLAFGPYGWVLIVANGLLIVLQAALWTRLARRLADDTGIAVPGYVWLLLGLFVGLFVAVNQRYPFAQSLVYVLLPLLLGHLWAYTRGDVGKGTRLLLLAVVLPLVHTACFAFTGATALLIAVLGPRSSRGRVLAALVLVLPAAAWLAVRLVLGQSGSHCVGLGAGQYGPLAYALQLLHGPGRLLVPDRLGVPIAVMALLWLVALGLAVAGPASRLLRFGLAFAGLALGGLFVLFNVAWISASIGGRFVLFVPLLFVPLLCLATAPRAPRLVAGLLVVAMLPQLYWFGVWAQEQRITDRLFAEDPTAFLPHAAYATRDHLSGPPIRRDGRLLVAPNPTRIETEGTCR